MIRQKIYELKNWKGVVHTTWNPEGPGVIRIHLIPPKFVPFRRVPSIAILNGQDILPVDECQAILLTEFINNVNSFGDGPMTDEQLENVLKNTFKGVKRVFPFVKEEVLRDDLDVMVGVFEDVVAGRVPDTDITPISIGEYAPYMTAPHRMDLMVSAMTKNGGWNCNQRCLHCYAAGQKYADEQELSTEDWKKIIDICRHEKISQLTFTGGEPTMRSDIPELIKYSRWFVTRLNTNGVNLTPEFCASLREAELDSVQVTCYSHEPVRHNALVGAQNWEKTIDGICNALDAGLNLSVNTPLCSINKDYAKTLQFLHEQGVRYVTCSGLIISGNATEESSIETQLKQDELYEVLKAAVEYAYSHDMEISFTSPGWISPEKLNELGLDAPGCGAALSNMAVTPGGRVVPCQSWLTEDSLGNILTDGWKDIWNSERTKKIRAVSAKMESVCQLRVINEKKKSGNH